MENLKERALKLHEDAKGKVGVYNKVEVNSLEDLSLVYSPGVAEPCLAIKDNVEKAYDYTWKGNTVAVISNGTAVLGLGNIGPEAGLPVMEGKSMLFNGFAGINAIPLVINETDPDAIIKFVKQVSPTFGGVNLEDIKAPECVYIEQTLIKECDIPVFHDDQHGTAIVVIAGLINASKLTGKRIEDCKVVVSGTGAAGSSIIRMLHHYGVKDIYAFGSKGIIDTKNKENYNFVVQEICDYVAPIDHDLTMREAMTNADVFIGVSVADRLTAEDVAVMAKDAIVFGLANPNPEIPYDVAKKAGARIVGTGRSDYPNQVNNVLAFPGIFKGALSVRASKITESMKIAAAEAIASLVDEDTLSDEFILPQALDKRVADTVAKYVSEAAIREGVIRK